MTEFLEYKIESEAIILGERVKGGIFRPSCKTLRWSTITMALRKMFGVSDIHAVGVLDEFNIDYFVYSPMERVIRTSKIPLQVEVLNDVKGMVYIIKNEKVIFPREFTILLGALISKGFGKCKLMFEKEIKIKTREEKKEWLKLGILNTRIPIKYINKFLINKKDKLVYGYLFEPISETAGVYIKSLFEGSEVVGPRFLLKDGENG